MLEGVVPYPPEFAKRYREKGYWEDRSIADHFRESFAANADRTAIIDRERSVTYRELDAITDRLALNLLELGLKPLDRVVIHLPNVIEYAFLYVALQKISAVPIASLHAHRYAECSQFSQLSGATTIVTSDRHNEFDFRDMVERVRNETPSVKNLIVLGETRPGFVSLTELIEKAPKGKPEDLRKIKIDPMDPAIFQLSGGTTGIPKLIPRTHNDSVYNTRQHGELAGLTRDSVLMLCLPVAHNFPLGGPGLQGFLFKGARVIMSLTTRPPDLFRLIQQYRCTHLQVVPALLIRIVNDPTITDYDLSSMRVIQSGGQRLQPDTRVRAQTLIPSVTVQETFGMSEGLVMVVRLDDPLDIRLETEGRPICPDDEVRLTDDDGNLVPDGEVGELCARGPYTLRGYFDSPEHNAKIMTADGFYKSGDLMRKHPSGNYVVEGRIKDLINRGGEKISAEEVENLILSHPAIVNVACVPMPDPILGEKMCACVILRQGHSLTLKELVGFLMTKEVAKYKLPERLKVLTDFHHSTFGKVSKKTLAEIVAKEVTDEQKAAR
jgi:2,3-dihydroxybenzoate-AMP ligase